MYLVLTVIGSVARYVAYHYESLLILFFKNRIPKFCYFMKNFFGWECICSFAIQVVSIMQIQEVLKQTKSADPYVATILSMHMYVHRYICTYVVNTYAHIYHHMCMYITYL